MPPPSNINLPLPPDFDMKNFEFNYVFKKKENDV